MKSISIHAGPLQHVLRAHPNFQTLNWQKQAYARTGMTFRFEVMSGRERRKIECIVHVKVVFDAHSASQHRAVVATCADWKNKRIGLCIADPVGIQALVEDVEWSEESSGS